MTSPAHSTAGKLAQLLGETILHHAPWTAEINETTRRRITDEWLDRLEVHQSKTLGPIVDMIIDKSNPPPEIKAFLTEAARPTAALGEITQAFLVYGVAFSVASTAMQPFLQALSNAEWPVVALTGDGPPLSPAVLATLDVRGLDWSSTATTTVIPANAEEAAKSGMSAQQFQALVDAGGNPPSPQDLFEMYRRGLIPATGGDAGTLSVAQGLKEGDTRDEWIDNFIQLAYTRPTPIDMVRAAVQAQLSDEQASSIATELGLDPGNAPGTDVSWFELLREIAGRPPGPEEVGRMMNRGIVPASGTGADATTFEQAIAESDVKTKWTAALQAIQSHYPSPDEAVSLYKAGSITGDQLTAYLAGNGVTGPLAAAYKHSATIQEVQQERAQSKGDILKGLYDGVFTDDQATALLADIGYTGTVATVLVELTNMRRQIRASDMAIRRVGSLYVGYKMTATDAKQTLSRLGLADDQATALLSIWAIERTPETRLPTIAELAKAVQYSGLPLATAVAKAMLLGYTEYDATLIIAATAEQPLPNPMPPDTDTGVDV